MLGRSIDSEVSARGITSRYSNRTWAVATIALFAIVFALRVGVYNPNDGLGLLFCLPIALAAVRFGPTIGLAAGLMAFVFYAVWYYGSPHVAASVVGYLSRLTVFLTLGGFVGYYARARAELDVRSRLLFDMSPDLMGSLDNEGNVVTANDAWRTAARHADHSAALPPDWRLELPTGQEATAFEQDIAFDDGDRRRIEWFMRRDPNRQLLYVVGRDVTERIAREKHVRELLASLQGVRRDERARIASELHDFVLQQLLVALMHAEHGNDRAFTDIDRFIRTAIAALRNVIDGIQPLELQHLGIDTVLDSAANVVAAEWDVEVERDLDVSNNADHHIKLLASRLVGEALRNAAKHAGAEHIRLSAREHDGVLMIEVSDDGRGMTNRLASSDTLLQQYGAGFNLLLDQLHTTGGHSVITSAPDEGTTIRVELPLAGDVVGADGIVAR